MYDGIDEILEYAQELFDVAGTVGPFLIMGLESRKDRNLDDYFVDPDGRFGFPGFAKNFSPKVEVIIKKLHENGFEAEQIRDDDIKFKQLAVQAGIGTWGKNSLVINHTFGPWLRFVVLKTNFNFTNGQALKKSTFGKCRDCDKCVRACPILALQPFHIPKKEICVAYDQLGIATDDLAQRCDICLQACMPQR